MQTQALGNVLGDMDQLKDMDWSAIPTGHYSTSAYKFPLTAAQIAGFGAEINPFSITTTTASQNQSTDMIQSLQVPDWFICLAIGVVLVPDVKHFTVQGEARNANPNPVPQPEFTGFVPANQTGERPAQLVWGHDSLQAAWAFLHAYNLSLLLQGKFELFKELSAHIGACIAGEPLDGFGQSNIAAMPYIRDVNDRLTENGSTRRFQQQTVIAGNPNTPAQPPMVPVTYGGMHMHGIFGGWYPTKGILMYPGMPIQARFTRTENDTFYHQRLTQALGNTGFLLPSPDVTEAVGAVGYGGSEIFKGGLFKVGLVMRGFSLAPTACVQAYMNMAALFGEAARRQMYQSVVSQLITQSSGASSLWGYPGQLAGIDDLDRLGSHIVEQKARGQRALPAQPLARRAPLAAAKPGPLPGGAPP